MSGRLLRKVLKEQEEQQQQLRASDASGAELEEDPDSPVSAAPSRNPFDLLDDQEDDQQLDDDDITSTSREPEMPAGRSSSDVMPSATRKSKKKKKKGKENSSSAKSKTEKSFDSILEDLSVDTKKYNQGSIHENIRSEDVEVQEKTRRQGTPFVLTVDAKYLKAENELRKIFGSKVVNSFENNPNVGSSRQMHGRRRSVYNPRKTILVSPSGYWPRWDGSLSMELLESKDGVQYFRYVHSPSYMHAQEAFEAAKSIHDVNAIASILARHSYHVEALLTFAEVFKYSGEHQSSADAVCKCLFALECAWHPLFSPLQGNCQIKYSHDTNKPLFQALFSHMKNMDRRGCHRSSLEVCKLLLSLDPDDPMGALFCIDYFSLRAQEFEWLEHFSEEYRSDNSLWLFPNFSYSLAICRFYIECDARNEKSDAQTEKATPSDLAQTEKATSSDLMKQALMLHPLVLKKLVAKAPLKDPAWTQMLKNPFFGSAQAGSPSLDHLINIYVERSYIMWRFPELQSFLKEAAQQVIQSLKTNGSEAKDWACVRKEAFSSEKNEYSHLMVSDFSDSVPTIPPEELRHFMVGPQMAQEIQVGDRDWANPERAHAPREVVGRNAAVVFLESLLPWVDYGANGNAHADAQDQHDD